MLRQSLKSEGQNIKTKKEKAGGIEKNMRLKVFGNGECDHKNKKKITAEYSRCLDCNKLVRNK